MSAPIEDMVIRAVKQLFEEYQLPTDSINSDTAVYGEKGGISSLALVRLIVDLEEMTETELNQTITIADEKVLSMKHSPFGTVGSLTQFISELLNQN